MISFICFSAAHMWEMKEWFFRFVVHVLWRRKKGVYYAVSVISIAGNLVVLVGPSLQTSLLSRSRVSLPAVSTVGFLRAAASTFGFPQTAFQAASIIGALQTRAWAGLPLVAELVLQRSVLYILLNLIVASIVVKSGVFMGWASSAQEPPMKQEAVSNLSILCGSHWLAPNYLQTIYGTLLNAADLSATSQSMLLQHAHHTHGRGRAATTDACVTEMKVQGHMSMHRPHHNPLSKGSPTLTPAPAAAPSPAPALPSLFTIEPLDEPVASMKCEAPIMEVQMSRHPGLRKVATKVDLLQAVRARRRTESRLKASHATHQQKSGRSEEQVKDKRAGMIRRKEETVKPLKQGKGLHEYGGGKMEGERDGEDDNDFKERVDTFISKFKRNLTMQRQDSLSRLLGLY